MRVWEANRERPLNQYPLSTHHLPFTIYHLPLLFFLVVNENLDPPSTGQTTKDLDSFYNPLVRFCRVPDLYPKCSGRAMNRECRAIEHYRDRFMARPEHFG